MGVTLARFKGVLQKNGLFHSLYPHSWKSLEGILFQNFSCANYFWGFISTASIRRRGLWKASKMIRPTIFTTILKELVMLHRGLWSWWFYKDDLDYIVCMDFEKACIKLLERALYCFGFWFFLIDLCFFKSNK